MVNQVTVIDVGGTYLRVGQWSPMAGLGAVQQFGSPSVGRYPGVPVEDLQTRLVEAIAGSVPANGLAGVSIGAALSHLDGTVYASAPLWGEQVAPLDMLAALQQLRSDVHWHVLNDVTAAGLHLAHACSGANNSKIMTITVSTGIAGRVIGRHGHIAVDACGLQGEIGHLHMPLIVDGEPVRLDCDCGGPGHLAAFSSGRAIPRVAAVLRERDPLRWTRSDLMLRIEDGAPFATALRVALDAHDPVAGQLLDAVTRPMADLLRTALTLDPEIGLIGMTGGVIHGLDEHYRAALLTHLRAEGVYLTSVLDPEWMPARIRMCKPHEADPLVGAGLAALQALAEKEVENRAPLQPVAR